MREVIFTGFGAGLKLLNVQGLANCPQWGLDNRIHIQAGGGNRGKVRCLKRPDLPEVELGGHDFWFDPLTYEFGLEDGGAQYGMSFDNYGRKFACSNSDHLQFFVYDGRCVARNPAFPMPASRQSIAADGGAAEVYRISPDEPWRIIRTRWRVAGVVKGVIEGGGRVSGYFTGASGTTVYRGDAYGDDFLNNTFTGDAGGQLVHRKKLYPNGVSLVGKRQEDEQHFEFAASQDTWARVVNFANAPDGCLHVIDMYREVIEHPWSIPDEIKKHLDLSSGSDRGRIYRIIPDDAKWLRRSRVELGKATTAELVETLGHPNGWHRDCAARLLYERQDKAAAPMLAQLMSKGNPLARIHALGILDGLGALSEPAVLATLKDTNPFVRERGVVYAILWEQRADKPQAGTDHLPKCWDGIAPLVADTSPRVRFYAALAAANAAPAVRAKFLAKLAGTDSHDPWINAAILHSADAALFAELRPRLAQLDTEFVEKLIATLAGSKRIPALDAELVELVASPAPRAGWIRALGEGLKRVGTTIEKVDSQKRVSAIFDQAGDAVKDARLPESARLAFIQILSFAEPSKAVPPLLLCLEAAQPPAIQAAAIHALGQVGADNLPDTLISKWSGLEKPARASALALLISRPGGAVALLNAIDSRKIAPTELTASDVHALLTHQDPSVATLAGNVLAALKPPSRDSVIAKYQPAIAMPGEAARGQVLFLQRCAVCHRASGQGAQVGPDLVTVKSRGRAGILEAILDPNKEVAPQYLAYTINTTDGQTLTGIIARDDASGMVIKMMGGAETSIARSKIKGASSSGQSLMPEGLEAGMSVQDIADLLTFIEEAKE